MKVWEHPDFYTKLAERIRQGLTSAEMAGVLHKDLPGTVRASHIEISNKVGAVVTWKKFLKFLTVEDADLLWRRIKSHSPQSRETLKTYPTVDSFVNKKATIGPRLTHATRRYGR